MGRQDECQWWSFSGGFDAEIFLVQGIPPLYGIFMVDFYGKGREIYHTCMDCLGLYHLSIPCAVAKGEVGGT